jgi:hypothetical protein
MNANNPAPESTPNTEQPENKEVRKKTAEEKKEEKDSLINLWMQDLEQPDKPKA